MYLKKTFLLLLLFVIAQEASAQNDYQRAHLWDKEIAAFKAVDEKEFPRQKGVLFVGSSSIRGWRGLNSDFPQFHPINRGFGGSHLEDVNFYFKQIVLPYKPKLIVLYAGENDIVAGKTTERVFADFKRFVSLVQASLPKTRIIFVSLKPSPARWQFADKLKKVNSLIKVEIEKDKRLMFVDVWTPMLDANGEPKKDIFLGDKIHMNSEGYKIWREVLLPYLKRGTKGNF